MDVNFSLQDIRKTAASLLERVKPATVLAFHGEMGAGKTTLIHAIYEEMALGGTFGSPTFSIINEYQSPAGKPVYHLDLYRLKDEEEAIGAGVEDVLYSGHLCLVEWPEKIPALLPTDSVDIYLETGANNTRKLRINL
jgi:tRNA threonylcarbamoyladenosine biosynthesis protein TsaE